MRDNTPNNNIEKISVIVPVYNAEKYLNKCIDSIINQTYSNIELIIIDDGSTDNSGNIADSYDMSDNRIKVVHIKNGGVSNARNIGLDLCTGDYISFVDGDDLIAIDMINSLYLSIEKNAADVSTCGFLTFHNTKNVDLDKKINIITKKAIKSRDALSEMLYQGSISNGPWGKLYKNKLFTDVRFPNGVSIAEDLELNYVIFSKAKLVAVDKFKRYYYRQHSTSATHCPFDSKKIDALGVAYRIYSLACTDNQNLLRAAQNRLFIEAINILIKVPGGRIYDNVRQDCESIIRNYRGMVIRDHKATARFRIYAVLSLLGADKLARLYKFKHKIMDCLASLLIMLFKLKRLVNITLRNTI